MEAARREERIELVEVDHAARVLQQVAEEVLLPASRAAARRLLGDVPLARVHAAQARARVEFQARRAAASAFFARRQAALASASVCLIGAGATVAIGGLVWLVLSDSDEPAPEETAAQTRVLWTGSGVLLQGSF